MYNFYSDHKVLGGGLVSLVPGRRPLHKTTTGRNNSIYKNNVGKTWNLHLPIFIK